MSALGLGGLVDEVRGHQRVLVGAPLWVRTASPDAVRIYAEMPDSDADG